MAIRKTDVADAGEFAGIMADGVYPLILQSGTGSNHAGVRPPETAAGGEVRLGLFVGKDKTIDWVQNTAAFEIGVAGEFITGNRQRTRRIGTTTQEI